MMFLRVPEDVLQVDAQYPFDIFIYDRISQKRVVAFYAEYELEDEKVDEIFSMVRRGGILQIVFDEKDIFCELTKVTTDELIDLNKYLFEMIELEEQRAKDYGEKAEETILLKTFFQESQSFKDLIDIVKAQVLLFPLSISDEVSLTTNLVETILTRDIPSVRETCIAYSLAKLNKVEDPEILSAVILASLFKDFGLSQVCRDEIFKTEGHDDFYFKHPMLSIYVLSKSNVQFSKLTKRLILEHHEVIDGTGFPRNKKEEFIHFLSHIIRVSNEICNLVNGKYNSTIYDWNQAFDIIIHEREVPGLKNLFPNPIVDLIKSLKT